MRWSELAVLNAFHLVWVRRKSFGCYSNAFVFVFVFVYLLGRSVMWRGSQRVSSDIIGKKRF
jgi:hypothetical protein